MRFLERFGPLVGRVLLMVIFVAGGLPKLTSPAQTAGYIASKGLPAPTLLAVAAGVVELVGALAIILGFQARWAALALAMYLVPVTLIFHNPSGLAGMEQTMQVVMFMKNLGLIGGLLLIGVHGAGPLSLDGRRASATKCM